MQKLPITGLVIGGVDTSVVVGGDPERVKKIATQLTNAKLVGSQREYYTYRGTFDGVSITACSHGVGAPGAAIAFEELIAAGGRRFIRVGTCGGLQPNVDTGQLVIVTAAVQNTGYGWESMPEGYPAVADLDMTLALRSMAAESGRFYHTGVVLSRDSFYAGVPTRHTPDYQLMSVANVLAVEMECAALFLVGSLRRVQTAAILVVDGNVLSGERMDTYNPHRQIVHDAVEQAIEIALRTLCRLEGGPALVG